MKGIKQIKDYRLMKELGRGANGIVYEAVEEKTNKLVAIKSIPNDKLNNPRIMEQFKKELKTLYRLSNKNIIKILGVEKTINNVYLVLEYCNGGTLYEYSVYYKKTYKDRLPESIVQKIIRQIIEGLRYMHKNNIIHRDIKMENILINFDDHPNTLNVNLENQIPKTSKDLYAQYDLEKDNFSIKIADLGYARDLEGGAGASTVCGTPLTIAPEIVKIAAHKGKDSKYNSAIDLWSLGAVLYELLLGVTPFDGNSQEDIMRKIYQGLYVIPSNISISLESIYLLNGLLQFYPQKRLSWDQILYHPFITKDTKKFKFIKLNAVIDEDQHIKNKMIIDSKDCSNLLWILFKATGGSLPFELDQLDTDTYEEIIKDLLHNEMFKESYQDKEENKEKNFLPQKNNHYENVNIEIIKEEKEEDNDIPEAAYLKKKSSINPKQIIQIENKDSINNQNRIEAPANENLNHDDNKNIKNESNFCLFDPSENVIEKNINEIKPDANIVEVQKEIVIVEVKQDIVDGGKADEVIGNDYEKLEEKIQEILIVHEDNHQITIKKIDEQEKKEEENERDSKLLNQIELHNDNKEEVMEKEPEVAQVIEINNDTDQVKLSEEVEAIATIKQYENDAPKNSQMENLNSLPEVSHAITKIEIQNENNVGISEEKTDPQNELCYIRQDYEKTPSMIRGKYSPNIYFSIFYHLNNLH